MLNWGVIQGHASTMVEAPRYLSHGGIAIFQKFSEKSDLRDKNAILCPADFCLGPWSQTTSRLISSKSHVLGIVFGFILVPALCDNVAAAFYSNLKLAKFS